MDPRNPGKQTSKYVKTIWKANELKSSKRQTAGLPVQLTPGKKLRTKVEQERRKKVEQTEKKQGLVEFFLLKFLISKRFLLDFQAKRRSSEASSHWHLARLTSQHPIRWAAKGQCSPGGLAFEGTRKVAFFAFEKTYAERRKSKNAKRTRRSEKGKKHPKLRPGAQVAFWISSL